jgi:threonyl-tRNA synthetase
MEEEKIKTHQALGIELDLFFAHEYSAGSPFFLPNGTIVYNRLMKFMRDKYLEYDYKEVITPVIASQKLWEKSGHWAKYHENMFVIENVQHGGPDDPNSRNIDIAETPSDSTGGASEEKHEDHELESVSESVSESIGKCSNVPIHCDESTASNEGEVKAEDEIKYANKAMNCPLHCLMFEHMTLSYRDLPLRLADFGVLHRNEYSGALRGLTRVRKFCQDDAHIFCMENQIQSEVEKVLEMIKEIYKIFNFTFRIELSTRPKKYIGNLETWNKSETILGDIIKTFPDWEINEGDGAFYGPKIDISIKDLWDREHQLATIQLDFNLPSAECFNLKYRTSSCEAGMEYAHPVIIHRAIYGSLERFIGILLEHTEGKLPFFISPRQFCIVPITNKDEMLNEYCCNVKKQIYDLFGGDAVVDMDDSANNLVTKIGIAECKRYNYIIVIGKKEMEKGTIAIRKNNKVMYNKHVEDLKDIVDEYQY